MKLGATFVFTGVVIIHERRLAPGPRMNGDLVKFKLAREKKAATNPNLYVSPSVGVAPLVGFSVLIAAAPAFYHCSIALCTWKRQSSRTALHVEGRDFWLVPRVWSTGRAGQKSPGALLHERSY